MQRNMLKKPIVVAKFGGTSVADIKRLTIVSQKLSTIANDYHLIVVVSAMSGVTNQLVSYCDHLAPQVRDEEVDVVLSSGEQVTSGLLALKLKHMGLNAISLMNWQLNIYTTPNPTHARIEELDTDRLLNLLSQNIIPVIPGFQGITKEKRITTLGRGGSDTTAVAIAAALQQKVGKNIPVQCDIYTDVDGIYTADPRFVNNAKRLKSIPASYMLELAQAGSKVLHPRSVQLALKYGVNVRVLSSFDDNPHQEGTLISERGEKTMEKSYVYGIAHQQSEHLVSLKGEKEEIQKIIKGIAALYLHADLLTITQKNTLSEITCMMQDRDIPLFKKYIEESDFQVELNVFTNKVKMTLVGVGLQNDLDVLNKIYYCVDSLNAELHLLNVSELKIAFVVDQLHTIDLLQKLHEQFIESL